MSVRSMISQHLSQRKVSTHIRVENKERLRVTALYLVTKVIDSTRSAQGSKLLIIPAFGWEEDNINWSIENHKTIKNWQCLDWIHYNWKKSAFCCGFGAWSVQRSGFNFHSIYLCWTSSKNSLPRFMTTCTCQVRLQRKCWVLFALPNVKNGTGVWINLEQLWHLCKSYRIIFKNKPALLQQVSIYYRSMVWMDYQRTHLTCKENCFLTLDIKSVRSCSLGW